MVTATGRDEAREANPGAIYATVPGAGHMVPWDNPAGFNAALDEVLESELAADGGS